MQALRRASDTADMRKGEKARLMMRPEYGYAMKDCKVRGCLCSQGPLEACSLHLSHEATFHKSVAC